MTGDDWSLTPVAGPGANPQIAARSERLIRLRDGAVADDIQLTADRPVQEIIRNVSQLG